MYDKELSLGLEILCDAVLPGCSFLLVRHGGHISGILGTIGEKKKNYLTLRVAIPRFQGWAALLFSNEPAGFLSQDLVTHIVTCT